MLIYINIPISIHIADYPTLYSFILTLQLEFALLDTSIEVPDFSFLSVKLLSNSRDSFLVVLESPIVFTHFNSQSTPDV